MAAVQKRFYVALDIKRPTANRDFEVVEGDNGNILDIELTDDGAAVDLSGCRALAIFSKSSGASQQDTDGHGVEVDAEQTNKLTIDLYTTSVAPGLVECELQVYSGDGYATLATTAKFNFMCRRGIANEDVLPSTEEWPLLVGALQKVNAAEAGLETLTQTVTDTIADLTQDVSDTVDALNAQTTAAANAATTATGTANTAADTANTAAGAAYTAASTANAAAGAANSGAGAANTAAGNANVAAEYANDQGDYAKSMGDAAASILESGLTWDTLPGVPETFPPSTHNHAASEISQDVTHRFATDAEKSEWNSKAAGDHTHTPASIGAASVKKDIPLLVQATGWTGSTKPYIQTIPVESMTASMRPFIDYYHVTSDDTTYLNYVKPQLAEFYKVTKITSYDGGITLRCEEEKPVYDFPIKLWVVQ